MNQKLIDRFMAKTQRQGQCLRWTAAHGPTGYGRFGLNGVNEVAHRAAWKIFVGPIPYGKEIDHVKDRGCVFRDCVDVTHLEVVTRRMNNERKTNSISEFPCGHLRSPENTSKGRMGKDGLPWAGECMECDRLRHRKG